MSAREQAERLDTADPLAKYRERFELPKDITYLDGNSLGALPKATAARVAGAVQQEWGEGLVRSWNDADWISMPQRIGAKIAPMIGAKAHEVIACDSTSVNIFKLISAALAMQAPKGQGRRKVILSEPGNFPTDIYMIEGLEAQGLAERRLAGPDEIEAALGEDVALLMLTHVHYKTGRLHDMQRLTKLAQDKGVLVMWDLAHSAGAFPVALNECSADFAVGCGYKYLNGGPGAPAFAFVAERHHDDLQQPLTGWMGHAQPFAFDDDYRAGKGVGRLLAGTPPILGMAALEVGVDLIAEIGAKRLAEKSRALSEFFREQVTQRCPGLELASPTDPMARGSQLSFRHEHAYPICQALIARGVIGDFRDPDILRFGFAPAYLRFADMLHAAEELADVINSAAWDREEFRTRAAVT
ncbi:kynureninase [Sphingomonadaceae bacterium]|nr:kynureninase [Sphingomonadaceae bacterium]